MNKTNKELYEDISKIFVEHGICSTDFAKLTELYRRTEMEGMVTEKRVLDEVIEGGIGKEIRLLKSYFDYEGEAVLNINDVKDLWKALDKLKQKYEVK